MERYITWWLGVVMVVLVVLVVLVLVWVVLAVVVVEEIQAHARGEGERGGSSPYSCTVTSKPRAAIKPAHSRATYDPPTTSTFPLAGRSAYEKMSSLNE